MTVSELGYAYVFLSNEHPTQVDVYFDDFEVVLRRSPVVAGGDFYPFGLPMENRQIAIEPYRYGYQGQFSEKDLTTGWNEFKLRTYDPDLGRWLTPDPLQGAFDLPYVGMANQPHMRVDPNGDCPVPCPGTLLPVELVVTATRIQQSATAAVVAALNTTHWYLNDFADFMTSKRVLREMDRTFQGVTAKVAGLNEGMLGSNLGYQGDIDQFGVKLGQGMSLLTSFNGGGGTAPSATPQFTGVPNTVVLAPPVGTPVISVYGEYGEVHAKPKMKSRVKEDPRVEKYEKEAFQSNSRVSKEVNELLQQLNNGNMNPGRGTKYIGRGIYEARSSGLGRIYFRYNDGVIEVLAYSLKSNQPEVIDLVFKLYGK